MKEHANSCRSIGKLENADNYTYALTLPRTNRDIVALQTLNDSSKTILTWPTRPLMAHGKLFFMKTKRENKIYTFETIMLGTEEDCKEYLSCITILDKDSKTFTTNTCAPRPISLEKWWDMGLMLSQKALAKIWTPEEEGYGFKIKLSINKV